MKRLLALLALAAAACGERLDDRSPPDGTFYYPVGLAVRSYDVTPGGAGAPCLGGAPGCATELLVVSTNFDLLYDARRGGTLLSVAVPAIPVDGATHAYPDLDVRGAVRIGSLGGEVAIVDAQSCPSWTGRPLALVASRAENRLYRVELTPETGALDCGSGCPLDLDPRYGDPFDVAVACRGATEQWAYVSYLRSPDLQGVLGRLDLGAADPTEPALTFTLGAMPVHHAGYQAASGFLFSTGRFNGAARAPLRWLPLGTGGTGALSLARERNLWTPFSGSETTGFALSSDGRRAYVALQRFNADLATATGLRPPDIGGTLVVVDLTPDELTGQPRGSVLRAADIGLGAEVVRVLPRGGGQRDLVAVTCTDGSLWIFDDEVGRVVKLFALDPAGLGRPLLGREPYGLAVEARASGHFWLYVGAFGSDVVTVIDVDPSAPQLAEIIAVLGKERT